jgi:hypothetical protein
MPKTKKGKAIMRSFKKRYGKRGASIAYATANKRGKGLYRQLHGKSKRKKKR